MGSMSKHGFARTSANWRVNASSAGMSDSRVTTCNLCATISRYCLDHYCVFTLGACVKDESGASISFVLQASESEKAKWPTGGHHFSFLYVVHLANDGSRLATDCTITNTGAAGMCHIEQPMMRDGSVY
jgi:hypothetical protein